VSEEEPEPQPLLGVDPIVWLAIVVEGGMVAVALFLGWLIDAPPMQSWRWDWLDAGWGLLATLPMLASFYGCLHSTWQPLLKIRQFTDEVLRPILAPCSILDLFGISVLAGIGEEMLFRGVLQELLTRWVGNPWLGLVLAAMLFGLMHAVTPTYALFAMLMGVFLGWVYLATGNLMVVALAHGLYDFIALMYLMRWSVPTTAKVPSEPSP